MKGVTFSEYYANKGVTKAQAVRAQHAGLQAKKATVVWPDCLQPAGHFVSMRAAVSL